MTRTSLAPANRLVGDRGGRARRDGLGVFADNRSGRSGSCRACRSRTAPSRCAFGSGSSAAAQYLSVMPSQPLVVSKVIDLLVFDVLVGDFLQLVAEHADQAFMQDVIAGGHRQAVARNQRVGIKRDRLVGLVGDFVLDGEQELVVDRDGAAEFEAGAVVPGQRHRMADVERAGAAAASTAYRRPAPSRRRRRRSSRIRHRTAPGCRTATAA